MSTFLTITLLVDLSLAGVIHNQGGHAVTICDPLKILQFPSSVANIINCKSFGTLQNGMMVCTDAPFDPKNPSSGSWQYPNFDKVFPDSLNPFSSFSLSFCGKCTTLNCGGRQGYDADGEPCSGTLNTSDFGQTWQCFDSRCHGTIHQLPDGSYQCFSDTCNGTSYMARTYGEWQCFDPACNSMSFSSESGWQCKNTLCYDGYATKTSSGGWQCVGYTDFCPRTMYFDTFQKSYICGEEIQLEPKSAGVSWLVFFITMGCLAVSVGTGCYTWGLRRERKESEGMSQELREKITV